MEKLANREIEVESIEELLDDNSIRLTFNPRTKRWRFEACFNHLRIPALEGNWRSDYQQALTDGYELYQALK